MSANRLANETSPYLLQHAHNPVDWYPWGDDAFARARAEDKPLLLSVGYSACHWCHVMERESFENADIAAVMNRHFVNVKVDREERPDVDQIYMEAVQSMTGHGGWPMTVFLTPEGVPFYGGTYFPPVDRHGLPGFPRLLEGIADAWRSRRNEVVESGQGLAFGDPECRRVCEETLDYVLREMTDPSGGFYSAQDADSEGHEGKFFVWTPEEMRTVLGDAAADAMAYWGVDRGPNFEGQNILYVAGEPDPARIARARAALFEARERRIHPGRDDKVLASWNGLAALAFAEAGRALGREDYVRAAVRNVEFVLGAMRRDGRLLRTWKGGVAKLLGYLEDHAMVVNALLSVWEATFERRWLDAARALADEMLRLFWSDEVEGFYDTGVDHEQLIVRPRNLFDNAVPCGSSVAIEVLLRLAVLTGDDTYEQKALRALRPIGDLMGRYPSGFGRFLCAHDFNLGPRVEIALVRPPVNDEALSPLLEEASGRYLPNRVVAGGVAGDATLPLLPLLAGREAIGGKPTAYVCRNYACDLPVTDRAALRRQLESL